MHAQEPLEPLDPDEAGESIVLYHDLTPGQVALITVIRRSELEAAGVMSVGEILQDLPWQGNAINSNFNNGGDGSTRVALRSLGTRQTQVLVNGRRHVNGGTGADGSMDLNAIPIALIDRIEVWRSAGAWHHSFEAAAGTINIVMRDEFSDIETSVYHGSTSDGLAPTYDAHVLAGIGNQRGRVMFSAGYFQQAPLGAGQRVFSQVDRRYDWLASDQAGQDIWEPGASTATPNGIIVDRLGVPDDTWPPSDDDPPLYNYQPENHLVTPSSRQHVYTSGEYRLTGRSRAFFEASYLRRTSQQKLAPTPLFTSSEGIVVSAENLYNPADRPFTDVRRRLVEAGNRRFFQDIDTVHLVAGAHGNFDDTLEFLAGWPWRVAYNHGRTSGQSIHRGAVVTSRLAQALGPSFIDADGTPRCGTVEDPGDPACVPLDLFGGAGSITPEMLEYVGYTGIATGSNQMHSWTVDAGGRLFELPWNGSVRLDLGFEYRSERGEFVPDPQVRAGDTTGNASQGVAGAFDVHQGQARLQLGAFPHSLPVNLTIELGASAMAYSTSGQHGAWYAGGLLSLHRGGQTRIRAAISRTVRAPSISALFSGPMESYANATDPCDTLSGPRTADEQLACQATGLPDDFQDDRDQILTLVRGDPQLEPERGRALTAGLVYLPYWIYDLELGIHYFDIQVEQARTRGAARILGNCYGAPSAERTDCDLVNRDPSTGAITSIDDPVFRGSETRTSGVEFEVRFSHSIRFGMLHHRAMATWLRNHDLVWPSGDITLGKGVYDLGANPAWKANLHSEWSFQAFAAGLNLRYIGSFRECQDNGCNQGQEFDENDPAPLDRSVGAHITADLYVNYLLRTELGVTRLSLGINNVLDRAPPFVYNGWHANSDAATYDFLGRYVYTRLVQQW